MYTILKIKFYIYFLIYYNTEFNVFKIKFIYIYIYILKYNNTLCNNKYKY